MTVLDNNYLCMCYIEIDITPCHMRAEPCQMMASYR